MRTGDSGRIAISWTQTEVDGLEAAPLDLLSVGSAWSWRGRALQLTEALVEMAERTAATNVVAELLAWSQGSAGQTTGWESDRIELSNGAQTFEARLVMIVGEVAPVLVFENGCPEPGQEFWINAAADQVEPASISQASDGTVVAFPSMPSSARSAMPNVAAFAAE